MRHNLMRLTDEPGERTHMIRPPARFHSGAHDCFAAISRIVSRLRPCGDGVLEELWAAGAAPAGGSSSPEHSAAAVPAGLRNPPFPNMEFCSRPGEDPNAWKHFGPEPDPGMRALMSNIACTSDPGTSSSKVLRIKKSIRHDKCASP